MSSINIKPVNGLITIASPNARLGGLNPAIADNEAVVMSQFNDLSSRVTAIETGTEELDIVEVGNGTETAPSITFVNDTASGLYLIGTSNIGFSISGTKTIDISAVGITVVGTIVSSGNISSGGTVLANDGLVGTPSFTFSKDTDTGLYRIGSNEIGIAANGALIVDIATTGVSVTGTLSASTSVTAGTIVSAGNGSAASPSITFTNSQNSGMYRIGVNEVGISAGGNKIIDITTSGVAVTGALSSTTTVQTGDGTVGAPSMSFLSNPNTGLYKIGANEIGVSCNGSKVLDIGTSGLAVTGTLSASTTITATTLFLSGDGLVGAPTYSFVSDPDTGIYRIGVNNIGVVANGAKVLDISTTGLGVTGTITTDSGLLHTGTITTSGAGTPQTLNKYVGTVTFTGVSDIAAGANTSVVINNSLVTASSVGLVSLQTTTAAAGSTPRIESVTYGSGTITIVLRNSAAVTATGASTYTFSFILFKL